MVHVREDCISSPANLDGKPFSCVYIYVGVFILQSMCADSQRTVVSSNVTVP